VYLSISLWIASGARQPIIDRFNREINRALAAPDIVNRLVRDGAAPGKAEPPEAFGAFIGAEMRVFADVSKAVHMTP